MGLTSSSPLSAGEQHIRVKKVRPSKTWTPPTQPQPKEEEEEDEEDKRQELEKRKREELEKKKREELEKRKEVKPVPKPEPGKMLCSGDPIRLTRNNFPGTSGQDLGRGGKDLALLGVCTLTGEEREMSGIASQCQRKTKGRFNEIKGFFLCLCWSVDESCHQNSSCFPSATS